jgi:hypothetical protein
MDECKFTKLYNITDDKLNFQTLIEILNDHPDYDVYLFTKVKNRWNAGMYTRNPVRDVFLNISGENKLLVCLSDMIFGSVFSSMSNESDSTRKKAKDILEFINNNIKFESPNIGQPYVCISTHKPTRKHRNERNRLRRVCGIEINDSLRTIIMK